MDVGEKTLTEWMRYIEVNRLWEVDDPELSPGQLRRISYRLIEHSIETDDYRHLNTALKLNDWLRTSAPDEYPKELASLQKAGIDALETHVGLR